MNTPADLQYTKEHEWIRVQGDVAEIGITDYAQGELGDVVFIEMPEVGSAVIRLEPFGTIEAVKAVSELFSPLTGVIEDVNSMIEEDAGIVNRDPYGEGWIIKIKLADPSQLTEMLDAAGYEEMVEGL